MKRPAAPQDLTPGLSPGALHAARRALLDHYDRTRRDLPWRGERDPYRVWVSEVMLQQTRVETVVPYYRRWLERFPDVGALADAGLDEVLLVWQGLGYYRRARGLHAGARVVRERHGGVVPADPERLRALPGVGEYTAAAVASIAFGARLGAVDGNVRRVLSRVHDQASLAPRQLRGLAEGWLDPERPGDWNEALMDLGATVCTPRAPSCEACPLATWCRARAAGTQLARPAPPRVRAVPARTFAAAVVVDGEGRALLARRPEGGLLAGLWAFPDGEVDAGATEGELRRVARRAAEGAGARTMGSPGLLLGAVAHRFTHLTATYRPVLLAGEGPGDELHRWVTLEGPWPVAVPVAQQKIARAASAVRQASETT